MFFPRALSITGRSHLAKREPGQDASFAQETSRFAVVAVSDGVGQASMSQVGSGLICRTAVHAVMTELEERPFDDVGEIVRSALARMLLQVRQFVGRDSAREMLPATLILGVLHHEGADVWAAGDGEACITFKSGRAELVVADDKNVEMFDGGVAWHKGGRVVRDIPYDLIRTPDADIPARVLSMRGSVQGIFVGTDGLSEATNLLQFLRVHPDAMGADVRDQLEAANTRDDASVAWAQRVSYLTMTESLPRKRSPHMEPGSCSYNPRLTDDALHFTVDYVENTSLPWQLAMGLGSRQYEALFCAANMEGGGHDWESVLRSELASRDPQAAKRITWDAEADLFAAYSATEPPIRALAQVLKDLLDDPAAMRRALVKLKLHEGLPRKPRRRVRVKTLPVKAAVAKVQRHLGPQCLHPVWRRRRPAGACPSWGCCYVAAEAVYHLAGGAEVGLKPMHLNHEGVPHWYLVDAAGKVIDPTADQFERPPDYSQGRGKGFLTRGPSRRAAELMERATQGDVDATSSVLPSVSP